MLKRSWMYWAIWADGWVGMWGTQRWERSRPVLSLSCTSASIILYFVLLAFLHEKDREERKRGLK